MKIEIDDELFSDVAKRLETTPENVIKVFLNHAKNLPHAVLSNANQKATHLIQHLKTSWSIWTCFYFTALVTLHIVTGDD